MAPYMRVMLEARLGSEGRSGYEVFLPLKLGGGLRGPAQCRAPAKRAEELEVRRLLRGFRPHPQKEGAALH